MVLIQMLKKKYNNGTISEAEIQMMSKNISNNKNVLDEYINSLNEVVEEVVKIKKRFRD